MEHVKAITYATLRALPSARDLLQLSKPGISTMSVIVAAGAMALALFITGKDVSAVALLAMNAGVALSVAGAGALNQWMEIDLDARMSRTNKRPLPDGRMDPTLALAFGLVMAGASMPLLYLGSPLAAGLNLIALIMYVLIYTPMKQRSAWAVVVGAFPGAMPALLGYAAVTGTIDEVGMVLFGIVFLWQLPHFLAITVYREKEYRKAGYVVTASVLGQDVTRTLIVATALPMVAVSLMLVPLDVAGLMYGAVAALLGVWFMVLCARGFTHDDTAKWARKVFLASLVYQTVLFGALALDVSVQAMFL
jgi:protoheme IX farnesyltransferase